MPENDGRLVYEVMVESMFRRALKGRVTPRLIQRVKEAGIDVEAKLKPSYPREVWMRCLHIIVEEVYPGVPRPRAFAELGERVVDSLRETVMGPAILGVMRLLGPKRALARFTQNFEYINNYNKTKLEEVGPNDFRLWVNETGVSPDFIGGTITGVLRAGGVKEPRVEVESFDGHACTYRVRF